MKPVDWDSEACIGRMRCVVARRNMTVDPLKEITRVVSARVDTVHT
jgi:hypothetical protein